jgi:hypothetical protein
MSRNIPVERDKRVSVIRELLHNIKAIKLNAWEEPFMHKAATARAQELGYVSSRMSTCIRLLMKKVPPLFVDD